MTWSRVVKTDVGVSAFHVGADNKTVRLGVGNAYVDLSEEDAASLGGYLLGTTNNDPEVKTQ